MKNEPTVTIPLSLAVMIRNVFLLRNPNKMRGADPVVVEGAREFLRVVARGEMAAESDAIRRLGEAVDYVNEHHPLPRCDHGNALRDHGGDTLLPSCGCFTRETP